MVRHLSSGIDWFHCFGCSFLLMILVFVVFLFYNLIGRRYYYKSFEDDYRFIEFFCSIFPSLVLLILIVPSLSLLYEYRMINFSRDLNVGVVGHQWYWSYEYSDYTDEVGFDSYMLPSEDIILGDLRLLDVDNRCVIPRGVRVGFLIGSEDVIHSWALPCMSIKVDAVGGAISRVTCVFPLIGLYYGQCSEICGAYHSFIPIVIESTIRENFVKWVAGSC